MKQSNGVFAGKTVVITGGSSGIGLAIAQQMGQAGAQVVLLARNGEKLEAAQAELTQQGIPSRVGVLDVTDEAAVAQVFQQLEPFDYLVTAAAGTARGTVVELETAKARALFESKYWGQYYCAKYGIPKMRKEGAVVLFSGWISRKPMVGTSALAAVDGAIESLARVLALEVAPIRVNAITPGMIDTPLWGARLTPEQQRQHFENVGRQLPVGRAGTAEDVADAVVFLLGNGFMTGAVLDIDGGQR